MCVVTNTNQYTNTPNGGSGVMHGQARTLGERNSRFMAVDVPRSLATVRILSSTYAIKPNFRLPWRIRIDGFYRITGHIEPALRYIT